MIVRPGRVGFRSPSAGFGGASALTLALNHMEDDPPVDELSLTLVTDGLVRTATEKRFGTYSHESQVNQAAMVFGGFVFDETADWTFEGWTWMTANLIANNSLVNDSNQAGCDIEQNRSAANTTITLYDSGGTPFWISTPSVFPSTSPTTSHWALVREGTTYSYYFNGTRAATTTDATNIRKPTRYKLLQNGAPGANRTRWDEVRVSQTARYSGSTYTIPTAAFTVD